MMTQPNDNNGNVTRADYLRIVRGSLRYFAIANALTYDDDNVRGTIIDYLQIVRFAIMGFEYVATAGMLNQDHRGTQMFDRLHQHFPVPSDADLQSRTVREWTIAGKVFAFALSDGSRRALAKELDQVFCGKRPTPASLSRLGLFWIAQTIPGLVDLLTNDEIMQAVVLCRPLWTLAEKREVGAIDIDFRPGPKLPLDTSRECGDCHVCRGVRDKFKCGWRLGFDLVHPTELGAFVIVGPASNGRHQIGVYALGGQQHTDGDLVQAVSGVVKQLGPTPCKVNIIRLEGAI